MGFQVYTPCRNQQILQGKLVVKLYIWKKVRHICIKERNLRSLGSAGFLSNSSILISVMKVARALNCSSNFATIRLRLVAILTSCDICACTKTMAVIKYPTLSTTEVYIYIHTTPSEPHIGKHSKLGRWKSYFWSKVQSIAFHWRGILFVLKRTDHIVDHTHAVV